MISLSTPPISGVRAWAPTIFAVVAPAAVVGALLWPLPLVLGSALPATVFTGPQLWSLAQMSRVLLHGPWTTIVPVGYPSTVVAQFVGWPPVAAALPLEAVAGPVVALNALYMLSPGVSAVAMAWLLRASLGVDRWIAAMLGVSFGLCPFVLGALGAGAMEKLQVWMYPLFLGALIHALSGRRGLVPTLVPALIAFAAGMTDPSMAVYLPFVGVIGGAWVLCCSDAPRSRVLGRGLIVVGASFAVLTGVASYFAEAHDLHRAGNVLSAFAPLRRRDDSLLVGPAVSVAEPYRILFGPRAPHSPSRLDYLTYLGIPAVVLLAGLGLWRTRGRGLGWALLVTGVVVAFGPWLVVGDQYFVSDGHRLRLPVWLLERAGFPTATSGTYYRAMPIVWMGMLIVFGGALDRWRRAGRLGAGIIAALLVADGVRVTSFMWPGPLHRLGGMQSQLAWAADPAPGAVFELMADDMGMGPGGVLTNPAILGAAIHGRATTALPRPMPTSGPPRNVQMGMLDGAFYDCDLPGGSARTMERLDGAGLRYLVWREDAPPRDEVARMVSVCLGPETVDSGLHWWRIPEVGVRPGG